MILTFPLSDWDVPTLLFQTLTPPQLEEHPVRCSFLTRQFIRDIQGSGMWYHTLKIILLGIVSSFLNRKQLGPWYNKGLRDWQNNFACCNEILLCRGSFAYTCSLLLLAPEKVCLIEVRHEPVPFVQCYMYFTSYCLTEEVTVWIEKLLQWSKRKQIPILLLPYLSSSKLDMQLLMYCLLSNILTWPWKCKKKKSLLGS